MGNSLFLICMFLFPFIFSFQILGLLVLDYTVQYYFVNFDVDCKLMVLEI